MAGYIEDRWVNKTLIDPVTKKKKRTDRYGKGHRYKVDGIPGVKPALFDTLKDAEVWKAKAAADSRIGVWIDPRDGDITLREYVEEHWWPALRKPPGTRESMEDRIFGHLLPHLGTTPLNKITTDTLNAWVVKAEKDISQGTVRTTWQHLSSILQSAKEAKRIPDNPCRGHETARPPAKPKTKARRWDRGRVLNVQAAMDARYQVLVDLGTGAGLRQGEAFGYSPDDLVQQEDGRLRIHVQRQVMRIRSRLCFGPPKGNKERRVLVPDAFGEIVAGYSERFAPVKVTLPWVDPDDPNRPWEKRPLVTVELLVTTTRRHALNRSDWNSLCWKPALGAAGIIERLPEPEGLTEAQRRVWLSDRTTSGTVRWPESREHGFHVLRHTYASIQLQAGESVVTLADQLGHADPAFTLRTYTHFMPEAGTKGMAAMDAWLRDSPQIP